MSRRNICNLSNKNGFTIVEVLVVVVVIGILSVITFISYVTIKDRVVAASLQSDLTNASEQLKLYQANDSSSRFPVGLDCSASPAANTICLKNSSGNSFTYSYNNSIKPKSFGLSANNGDISYRMTNSTPPMACPLNFIIVPGSSTYGTNDFCVMKYEAKNVDGVATSQAASLPWVLINQPDALAAASSACSGCHIITENEWLTIAQNVAGVPSNWIGGAVGSMSIYNGNNDSAYGVDNSLAADTDDSNGYYATGNTYPSEQRRTLTLSNGEVIWDFAGNVWEQTDATIGGGQQPGFAGETTYNLKEWYDPALIQNGLPYAMPSYTGIPGSATWGPTKGIGELYSNYGETGTRVFRRGGGSYSGIWCSGIFALSLYGDLNNSASSDIGFRAAF